MNSRARRAILAAAFAAALSLAGCAAGASEAPSASGGPVGPGAVTGTVAPVVEGAPVEDWEVTAFASGGEGEPARELGTATTDADGRFTVAVEDSPGPDAEVYVLAAGGAGGGATLAAVVPEPADIVINERTTVAAAYGLAQFVSEDGVAGPAPGVPNAVAMSLNLADPLTGAYGEVLITAPNGSETSTLAAFTSLTNVMSACVLAATSCAELIDVAATAEEDVPSDTFRALAAVARTPAVAAGPLFDLSLARASDRPGLAQAPAAWTLALRFDGDGQTLDGPGNFVVDPDGNIWVNNNYEYGPEDQPSCASGLVAKFSPDGRMLDTYEGGGLSGSGFGLDFDSAGRLWLSNFGFAGVGCTDQPGHDSLSLFSYDGEPLSPDTGFTQGEPNWPQGLIVSEAGDIWTANCAATTVTFYPGGDPAQGRAIETGLEQPFGVVDNGERVFVSGIANSAVAVFEQDGTPVGPGPLTGPAFDLPMGLAADPTGNIWVANSGAVTLPCPERPTDPRTGGSVSMISPDGATVAGPFTGGGTTHPWGITTDGDGNVWVANFTGQTLSAFCGADPTTCPPGVGTGDPISPDGTGFAFDGLVRNTGLVVDPSGNVWVANNWQLVPLQTNPGGHEIVAFVGLAEPVRVAAFTG